MAILLYVRGTGTLPIAIFSFDGNGAFEKAAAVSVVLVALALLAVMPLRLSGKARMEL